MKHTLSMLSVLCFAFTFQANAQTSFIFDFSNYVDGTQPDQIITGSGTAFDGTTSGMLFRNISPDSGRAIDLVLSSRTTYQARRTTVNGNVGTDIQLNQGGSIATGYNISFYDSGTTDLLQLGENDSFRLTFYDIDGRSFNGEPTERFIFESEPVSYITTTSTVNYEGPGIYSNQIDVGGVPNPQAGATDLTFEQENASVISEFRGVNSIDFTYETNNGPNNGRNLFIDGGDFVFDSAVTAPAAPTPPLYLAMILGVAGFIRSRVRRAES